MLKAANTVKTAKTAGSFTNIEKNSRKKVFGLLTKNVKYWDVYDPDWSYRNELFSLEPLRRYRM